MRVLATLVLLALAAPATAQAGPDVSITTDVVPVAWLPLDGSEVALSIPATLTCGNRVPLDGTVVVEGRAETEDPAVEASMRHSTVELDCITTTRATFDLEVVLRAGPGAVGEHSSSVGWKVAATYEGPTGPGTTTTFISSVTTVPFHGALAAPEELRVRVHGDRQAFVLPVENTGNAPTDVVFAQGPVHLGEPASYADRPAGRIGTGAQEIPLVFDAPSGAWGSRTVELSLVPTGPKSNETGAPVPVRIVFENANALEANVPAIGGVLLVGLVAVGNMAWRRQASKAKGD